jgi:hypothetical protein
MPHSGFVVPSGGPDPAHRDLMVLGSVAMYTTVFLALVVRGYSGQEAIALTVGLAIAGLEVVRRLPPPGQDERRKRGSSSG